MYNRTDYINHGLLVACVTGSLALATPARGQVIHEDHKILANDGAMNDHFGHPIALADGIIVVGARFDDDNGHHSGSVYLFDAFTGKQFHKILPSDGASEDIFGSSIAFGSGIVVVGAERDDDNGRNTGSVYLFDASTGTQIAKLHAGDASPHDYFGCSIAMDDCIIVIGAYSDNDHGFESGSVYLFDVSTGEELIKITPADGAEYDHFGQPVAINNGIIVVGARGADDNGEDSGSAYAFDVSTGTQLFKLMPSDGEAGDRFGSGLAIDNGIIVVGAAWDDDNGRSSGSVYLFDALSGTELAKLLPSDGAEADLFGGPIAIGNSIIGVGAFYHDSNGNDSGVAYLFDATTGAQLAKLFPSDGGTGKEYFGSIAIDGNIVVVGATGDDTYGTDSGAAYVLDIRCPADLNHDDLVDDQDFFAFLRAWTAGDLLGNWNMDGTINTQDFIAYLGDWAAGCP